MLWKYLWKWLLVSALGVILLLAAWLQYEHHRISRFDSQIAEAAGRYHIDHLLIRAVIWRETDFSPNAKGDAGERGLMQVTPAAGKDWARAEHLRTFRPTDLFDPRTNIMAGTWYLAQAHERWKETDRPVIFALAEYNAGRRHALRWANSLHPPPKAAIFIETIDFPTTKSYVLDILHKHSLYQKESDPAAYRLIWEKLKLKWWAWREKNQRKH